jgi:uncharacterized membrane protein
MTPLHAIAGLLALASGAVALYAKKGAMLHRKSGMVFVYSMLFMSASGAVMAALQPSRISLIAGLLTFYLVATALLTVRRPRWDSHWIDAGAMLLALGVSGAGFTFAFIAANSPGGKLDGLPAAPGFMFGVVALLASLGDIRMLRARGIQGAPRIARHLWRMCFALFIASASLLSRPRLFPKPLRDSGLLPIPIFLVLLLMFYWLARVRFAKRHAWA